MTFSSSFYSWFTNGISHEFGHFIDWYTNLNGFVQTQNSVAENVSVSFSYICNENLDAYFNDTNKSNILCVSNALDNTLNYVNDCLSTSDLELYAFQNVDTITPSEIQDKQVELLYEYGLLNDIAYQLGGLKEYNSYVDINQIYTQPFYNTDYAMSGLTALNVLNTYVNDNSAGLELFDNLYTNDYYYDDYVTMMSEGLGIDIYADDYVTNIAQNLDSYLNSKMVAINGGNLGDVNLDGVIDPVDLLTLKKYLLGMDISTLDFYTSTADLNSDGSINILDLLTLKRILLQIG
jgi:oligoendopeptidase F